MKTEEQFGKYKTVSFLGSPFTAWIPSRDIWNIYFDEIPDGYVPAQIADDAPYRLLKLLD